MLRKLKELACSKKQPVTKATLLQVIGLMGGLQATALVIITFFPDRVAYAAPLLFWSFGLACMLFDEVSEDNVKPGLTDRPQ